MRLTKYQKESIVRAIMLDVPQPDYDRLVKEAQERIVKAMSKECRAVFRKTPNALAEEWLGNGWRGTYRVRTGDCPKDIVHAEQEAFRALSKERNDAYAKLYATVNGCNTAKQLHALLPEFKQYFPTESKPTANLPAVANVVADLTKLGWTAGGAK